MGSENPHQMGTAHLAEASTHSLINLRMLREKLESSAALVWWVDPGWTPGACQAALSLLLLNWAGEREYNERLMGRDKDGERSLSNCCHGQNRLDLGKLV